MATEGTMVRVRLDARTGLRGQVGRVVRITRRSSYLVEFLEPTAYGPRLWFQRHELEYATADTAPTAPAPGEGAL